MQRLAVWAAIYSDVLFQRWHVRKIRGVTGDTLCKGAEGKTYIVTGPTSGIGTEIAAALTRCGATVVLACRTLSKGHALVTQWTEEAKAAGRPAPKCEVMELDLNSLASVRRFAEAWKAKNADLHVLVNNAGIFDMGTKARRETADGYESHFGTNYMAPVLLTLLLLPYIRHPEGHFWDLPTLILSHQTRLISCDCARVVFVSSKLHQLGELDFADLNFSKERPYSRLDAYAQSKLAEVAFCEELEERVPEGRRLRVVSVHPGNVVTGVVRTLPVLVQRAYAVIMGAIILSPAEGARSVLHAAVAPEVAALPRPGPYLESGCNLVAHCPQATDLASRRELWEYTLKELGLLEKDVVQAAAAAAAAAR